MTSFHGWHDARVFSHNLLDVGNRIIPSYTHLSYSMSFIYIPIKQEEVLFCSLNSFAWFSYSLQFRLIKPSVFINGSLLHIVNTKLNISMMNELISKLRCICILLNVQIWNVHTVVLLLKNTVN